MARKSIGIAAALSFLIMLSAAAPAAAKGPLIGQGTGGEPPNDRATSQLTAEQLASRETKERLIASVASRASSDLVTMSCPIPNGGGLQATSDGVTASCGSTPSKYVLGVSPRQQERSDYCGPAVAQVVSNYSWKMSATQNKYSQKYIADNWARTSQIACDGVGGADGGTCIDRQVIAMNNATKRPSNFAYIVKHNPTFANWHSTIVSGVYDWRLPLAAGVRPWKLDSTLRLVSWTKKSHGGHYITLHGYQGFAGSSTQTVYYSDSAGAAASGMAAGNYVQSSRAVWTLMQDNNKNMIY